MLGCTSCSSTADKVIYPVKGLKAVETIFQLDNLSLSLKGFIRPYLSLSLLKSL